MPRTLQQALITHKETPPPEVCEPCQVHVPIAVLGEWVHPVYGEVSFTEQDFAEMTANWRSRVSGYEPPLYIGHGEDLPARGYLVDIYSEESVLWGVFELLGEETYSQIEGYRYSSPEIVRGGTHKETGEVVGMQLKALALTNHPFLTGMPRVQLSTNGGETYKYFFMPLDGEGPDLAYETLLAERRAYGKSVAGKEGNYLLYVTGADNPFLDQGYTCADCALYTGAGLCELFDGPPNPVDAGGYCKVWFPLPDESGEDDEYMNELASRLDNPATALQAYSELVAYVTTNEADNDGDQEG